MLKVLYGPNFKAMEEIWIKSNLHATGSGIHEHLLGFMPMCLTTLKFSPITPQL